MRRIVFALVAVGAVALEVFVFVQVAQLVGWWVVPLLVLTSLAGGWLVKREGAKAWSSLWEAARTGAAPAGRVGDAAVVLVGGLLILLPGFVTDVLGALVVLPVTRPLARRALDAALGTRMADLETTMPPPFTAPGYGPGAPAGQGPAQGDVVEGRVVQGDVVQGEPGRSTPTDVVRRVDDDT